MKYAIIALIIACWTAVAFIYRFAAARSLPRIYVATGASGVLFALAVALNLYRGDVTPEAPAVLYAVGAVAGIAGVACVPFFAATVARGSLAVSWTILTLSFAAASLASLLYPGASVNAAGVAGLAAAAAAIVLLGRDGAMKGVANGFKPGWGLFMTLAFIFNALYLYVYTLAQAWAGLAPVSHKMAMLLANSAAFFVGSAILCAVVKAPKGRRGALLAGAGMGLAFFAGNIATMYALGDFHLEPYIFFPATTGGSTLTVALLSAVVFHERPGVLGWIGLALGLAAMLLLGASA